MSDVFEQLRPVADPAPPDPGFVARLRARVAAALDAPAADLPTIDLPERTTTMTDIATAPAATATMTPYICVAAGTEALTWYRDVFGAVETIRYTADDGRIGHAEITIGGAVVMLSDEYPELGVVAPPTLGGTATTLHLSVPDVDAVYALAVANGGRVAGEPKHEAYGARSFSMLDPFGHRWMVQTPEGAPTIEEVAAASPGFTITTAAAPATPIELGYYTISVPDTARAGRFYGALFGWAADPDAAADQYAHVGNTRLPFGFTPGTTDEPPVLYYRVDDIDAVVARVPELGGEVVGRATYDSGPNAVCRDDQGREFQLWQPAPGYE